MSKQHLVLYLTLIVVGTSLIIGGPSNGIWSFPNGINDGGIYLHWFKESPTEFLPKQPITSNPIEENEFDRSIERLRKEKDKIAKDLDTNTFAFASHAIDSGVM